jgi:hypothetical protein
MSIESFIAVVAVLAVSGSMRVAVDQLTFRILALLRQAADRAVPTQEITDAVDAERWQVLQTLERLAAVGEVERIQHPSGLRRASWKRAIAHSQPSIERSAERTA